MGNRNRFLIPRDGEDRDGPMPAVSASQRGV